MSGFISADVLQVAVCEFSCATLLFGASMQLPHCRNQTELKRALRELARSTAARFALPTSFPPSLRFGLSLSAETTKAHSVLDVRLEKFAQNVSNILGKIRQFYQQNDLLSLIVCYYSFLLTY